MQQYTLTYTLDLWQISHKFKKVDGNLEKYLSIALRKYVLTELDPKIKNFQLDEFAAYGNDFPVAQLKDALQIFERQITKAIENKEISTKTAKNYRSAVKRFFEWLEKQPWWISLFPDSVVKIAPSRVKIAPKPGTGTGKASFYGLSKDDLPLSLINEIEEYKDFRLTGGKHLRRTVREYRQHRQEGEARRPKIDAIKQSTLKRDEQAILCFLGWYVENHLLSESHLRLLTDVNNYLFSPDHFHFLSNEKFSFLSELQIQLISDFRQKLLSELHLELLTDVDLLDEYTYWVVETRGVSHSTGVNMAKTSIAIAKWLNYDKSTRRNWSDIPLILDLKDLRNEFAEEYSKEKEKLEAQKWEHKQLTHEQARQVVDYLRKSCATHIGNENETGKVARLHKRNISAVARSWQIYLIVKILVYCPVRQEEIRNFKLGETLFRCEDEDGNPYYVAKLTEHKNSGVTGKPRHYKLPTILTQDLDMWIYKWRPLIEESIKTLDEWMKFWGHNSDKTEKIHSQLSAAKQGVLSVQVQQDSQKYIEYLEKELRKIEQRIAFWQVAKTNFENHNHLFFKFGKNRKNGKEVFGNPLDVTSIWQVVIRAFAISSKALFGEERWTNPHALRHIAEKHIRQSGKQDITESFAMLIGHSKKIGDEYARQITSEYELSEDIVDDWWQE
ncbi:MAG: hypothetical protein KME49_25295 [Brasilonema octagenarum HA4186-MV1]|jgi:integrase|nr:hypothetical protein [Brasilonema octagenarum HA4186-MV1]